MEQINVKRLSLCLMVCWSVGFSNMAYGTECAQKVQPIKENQVANCQGYLFSPEAESEAYKATRLVDLYKDQNQILEERLKLYINESTQLAKEKARRGTTEDLIRIGYFFGGMLVTALVVRNVRP